MLKLNKYPKKEEFEDSDFSIEKIEDFDIETEAKASYFNQIKSNRKKALKSNQILRLFTFISTENKT